MEHKKRQSSGFTSLGTVLDDVLPQFVPIADGALTAVWGVWENVVGPEIHANAQPVAFKGNLLLIHVSNSIWVHHLRFLEKELIDKLNKSMENVKIAALKVMVGNY